MRFMDGNTCTGKVWTRLAVQTACGLMSFPLADDEIGIATREKALRLQGAVNDYLTPRFQHRAQVE
jgi:hypothetical protein